MGPQLVRCGKRIIMKTIDLRQSRLQWGRNLFVAESDYTAGRQRFKEAFNGAATCSLRKVIALSDL